MAAEYYTHQKLNTPTEMPETSNYDFMNNYLLRVVALGNLSLFAIADHHFITLPAFSRYLAIIIILTEIIFVVDGYYNIITQRRQQPNLRQWPASTTLIRGAHHHMVYHIYFMNVLLFFTLFCQGWEYTNYFCGVLYSGLVLLTL